MKNEFDFVVNNEFVRGDESEVFFSGDEIELIREDADCVQILYLAGIFPSRSQAMRNFSNFKNKFGVEKNVLPKGFIQFRAGKTGKLITVLNPTEDNLQ